MAQFEIVMPKMGESIEEATITNWFVKEGDRVEEDDVLLEIATDKVDSEIPSPVEGMVKKIMYKQDETVAVGSVIAVIDMGGEESSADEQEQEREKRSEETYEKESIKEEGSYVSEEKETSPAEETQQAASSSPATSSGISANSGDRFYSPLVRKIAQEEKVSADELEAIEGSGLNGRVQKRDILDYLDSRKQGKTETIKKSDTSAAQEKVSPEAAAPSQESAPRQEKATTAASVSADDEIREMDRMRKIIAEHMIRSKQVSAHVTNMLESDVTNMWSGETGSKMNSRAGKA